MTYSKRFLAVLLAALVALCIAPGVALAADGGSAAGGVAKMSATSLKALDADTIAVQPKSGKSKLTYRGYLSGKGWSGWKKGGKTLGQSDVRLQAVRIKLNNSGGLSGGIQYRVNTYAKGWQKWVSSGKASGKKGYAVMGIQIKLTGDVAQTYDVVYRLYHADRGWLPWAMNGSTAGLATKDIGNNQLQVKLVKKGKAVALAEGAYAIGLAKSTHYVLGVPYGKDDDDLQVAQTEFTGSNQNERFYVRKESDGTVSIQNVASGKFLYEASGGAVLQRADSADPSYRWVVESSGAGYALKNAASGNYLALSGGKAQTGAAKCVWMFSSLGLVPDGTFIVYNKAKGNALDLVGMGYDDGTNIRVMTEGAGDEGSQAFSFTNKGSNIYRIDNAGTFKTVEVAGGSASNGANVRQATWKSSNAQKWAVTIDRAGDLTITNLASNKVLTAVSGGKAGANVVSSADTGAATQRWTLAESAYESNPGRARAISKAKGLSSNTSYLILVDLTKHWLTIFKKSGGGWRVDRDWQISCGSSSHPTVVGHYTVGSRGYSFGDGYTCYYWTQFYGDYLFHSIKYYPGTFKVMDGRLGKSISMGCVRMNINNAKWINQHIPSGTHVYTYR